MKEPNKVCLQCGKKFYQPHCLDRIKYCSKDCYYIAKKGRKATSEWKANISKGVKANLPSTAWKKGQHFNIKTEFKKGEHLEENNPNWTGGKYAYRRIFNRNGKEKICSICGEKEKRIIIHHIDRNRNNNKIENLLPLCDKCHVNLHWKIRGTFNHKKKCEFCGIEFITYKKEQRFCSIRCGLKNRWKK